ncbi:hypothetical protein [Microbispora sp. CA-102843]
MPNLGPSDMLVILLALVVVALIIGGIVFAAVKLANRSKRS